LEATRRSFNKDFLLAQGGRVDRQHKLPTLVGSSARLFNFNGTVIGRMQAQIGQVSFGKPCPDLLHTAKDLGKANAMM